tara:strand:- start:1646 stop:2854 length:1209 start_codon:yes stop_codon:yes gene_type:complete
MWIDLSKKPKKMVLYLRFKALGFFKTIKPTRGKAITTSMFSLFALGLIFGGFLNPGSNKTLNAWESTTYNQGPPEFEILSAYAFQNIYKNGDIVFLSRIHLEQDKTKMATTHPAYNLYSWCDLLIDTSGCNSTPVNPTSPDRIDVDETTGKVPLTFDLKENNLLTKSEPFIPRINYGFVGIYIENTSTANFDINNNVTLCLSPNTQVWNINNSPDCKNITIYDGRDIMKEILLDEVELLQNNLKLPKYTLINQAKKITYEGNIYVDEGVPIISKILGGIFETGLDTIVNSTPVPTGTDSALGTSILNEYTSTGLKADIDNTANYYFGVDGKILLIVIFGFFALLGAITSFIYTQNGQMSFIIFSSIMLIGFWTGTPSVGVLFVAITVMALFTTAYILRKFPS